jgi:prevent-host-death family protein
MLNILEDICSMTEFKRHTGNIVAQVRDTGRPVVLTVNGRSEVVVQDAAAYQHLLNYVSALEELEEKTVSRSSLKLDVDKPGGALSKKARASSL